LDIVLQFAGVSSLDNGSSNSDGSSSGEGIVLQTTATQQTQQTYSMDIRNCPASRITTNTNQVNLLAVLKGLCVTLDLIMEDINTIEKKVHLSIQGECLLVIKGDWKSNSNTL
jgi:hypothetical protein